MNTTSTAPRHKDVWSFRHADLPCEVTHHAKGERVNEGKGIWCYYVYIPESKCTPAQFAELWLPDRKVRFYPVSPERITHDGSENLFPDAEWHGGVTYYGKHGYTEGFRCVKIGCDFSHFWDHERGGEFRLEEVEFEARRTAELIAAQLKQP